MNKILLFCLALLCCKSALAQADPHATSDYYKKVQKEYDDRRKRLQSNEKKQDSLLMVAALQTLRTDSINKVNTRSLAKRDSVYHASTEYKNQVAEQLRRDIAHTEVLNQAIIARTKVPGYAQHVPPVVGKPLAVKSTRGSVYVCGGSSAYAYHSSTSCGGLRRCSGTVSAMSIAAAQQMGRRPCKKCM